MLVSISSFLGSKRNQQYVVFLIYVTFHLLFLVFHEPWRDELQSFSIAQQSSSISQLLQNKVYEGHPDLWYTILFAVTRFSNSVFLIKIIHLCISCIAIWLFLEFCPLRNSLKYLIVFGYFFVYEYTVMFRNYSIELLLAFAFCALLNRKYFLLTAMVSFLLLQTNLFGFFIGCSLWLIYVGYHWPSRNVNYWIATLIVLSGAVISVYSMIPPPDGSFAPYWNFHWRAFSDGFPMIWNAFIPVPEFNIHFWNTNFIDNIFSPQYVFMVKMGGSIAILLLCIYSLRNSKRALFFFLLSVAATITFFSVKYNGDLRHHGQLFLAFIIALWIREISSGRQYSLPVFPNTVGNKLLLLQLLLQLIAGISACYYDFKYPFSNASEAARYIRSKKPGYYLIGNYDSPTSAVAILLGHKIFYPGIMEEGLFIKWRNNRQWLSDSSIISVMLMKKKQHSHVLLISSREITNDSLLTRNKISIVKKFEPSIVADEQFFIYE